MKLLVPPGQDFLARNNFDALRLFLAVVVVVSHAFPLYYGDNAREWVTIALRGHHTGGHLAVLGFFIISGFLILHSYVRSKSARDYLVKRVRRIHPGYLVATAFCTFLVVPLYDSHGGRWFSPSAILTFLWQAPLLRSPIPPSDAFASNAYPRVVNGAIWSIPFEFWCYLGLLMMGIAGLVTRRSLVLSAYVLAVAIRLWLDITGRKPGGGIIGVIIGWPYLWFEIMPCFLLGMLTYLYRERIVRSRPLCLIAAVLPFAIAWARLPALPTQLLMFAASAPCIAYVIFFVAFSPALPLHNAGRFGDFSYGTYLYGFPLQQVLAASVVGRQPFVIYVACSVLLSLVAGAMSWLMVERWFLPPSRRSHKASPAQPGPDPVLVPELELASAGLSQPRP